MSREIDPLRLAVAVVVVLAALVFFVALAGATYDRFEAWLGREMYWREFLFAMCCALVEPSTIYLFCAWVWLVMPKPIGHPA